MRKLKDDKKIKWTESYTEKTRFLKDMYHDIIGPKSYYRFEGKEIGGSDQWYVIVSPSGVKEHEKKWFAGIRKLPDKWPAGGKKFDSITDAFAYANDTWGVPRPQSLPHYTMTDLKLVASRENEWRKERESEEALKDEDASSSSSMNRFAMGKSANVKSGMAMHVSQVESLVGDEVSDLMFTSRADRPLSPMQTASAIAVGVRKNLLWKAARAIASLHPASQLSIPGDTYSTGGDSLNIDDIETNKRIVLAYADFLDKRSAPKDVPKTITAKSIENCITWNKTISSSISLSASGLRMRKVLQDFASVYWPQDTAGLSVDAIENFVLSTDRSTDALTLASAVKAIDHIANADIAVGLLSTSDNDDRRAYANIVSMSQVERSMVWMLRENNDQKGRYRRKYAQATGESAPANLPVPIAMFLEMCRTDDRQRAILVGPYMSNRSFGELASYRITEQDCENMADDQSVTHSADEMIAFASDRGLLDVDLDAARANVFFRHFSIPNRHRMALAFEDIPVTYGTDGVRYIRAHNGSHKRRILETIGSWYYGSKPLPENDPIDNPLLSDMLLKPRVVPVRRLIEAIEAIPLTDISNRLLTDYYSDRDHQGDVFISYDHFMKTYATGQENAGLDEVFWSCNSLLEDVRPSLGKDGISPSVEFTPKGYLATMRYVLGDKWNLKTSNPDMYRKFLLDVLNMTHVNTRVSNFVSDLPLDELERMADDSLINSEVTRTDVPCTYATAMNRPGSIGNVSARKMSDDLDAVFGNSIARAVLGNSSAQPGGEALAPTSRVAADDDGEATRRLLADMSAVKVRLKRGYRPTSDVTILDAAPPQGSLVLTQRMKGAIDFSRLFDAGQPVSTRAYAQYSDNYGRTKYAQLTIDDVVVVMSSPVKSKVDKAFEATGKQFRTSTYDPSKGSAISFSDLKDDQKNDTVGEQSNDHSYLLDKCIVGNVLFGEVMEAAASGWYGETPIRAMFDRDGNMSFPFATDDVLQSSGTRDLWLSGANVSRGPIIAELNRVMSNVNTARRLVAVATQLVSQRGFWWKPENEQPTQDVVRTVKKNKVTNSYPLIQFMNLSASQNSDLLAHMKIGMGLEGEQNPSGEGFDRLRSYIELTREGARTYASSIIMADIHNGMIEQIFTPEIMSGMGIQSIDEVTSVIPGAGGSDDIVSSFETAMAFNDEIDVVTQEDAEEEERQEDEDGEEAGDDEDAESVAEEAPVGQSASEEAAAGESQDGTESPAASAGPEETPPVGPAGTGVADASEFDFDSVDFSGFDYLSQNQDALSGSGERQDDEPAEIDVPAVASPAGVNQPVPSPAPGVPSPTSAAPAAEEEDEDEDEDVDMASLFGRLSSTNQSDKVRGIIKNSVVRLARMSVLLAQAGKTVASIEVNRIIKKVIGPERGAK
jgi:hypothetical protein